jgi:outer membrane protein
MRERLGVDYFDLNSGVKWTAPKKILLTALLTVICLIDPGQAETLVSVYNQALATNPALQSARADLAAERAARGVVRAGLLPHLKAAAAVNYNDTTIQGFGKDLVGKNVPPGMFAGDIEETYSGGGYSIRLVQPLVDGQAWSAVKTADARIGSEAAAVAVVEQGLIIRVVNAYFNLLKARADEQVVLARKKRLAETLAQAEADLQVGAGDIIAVHESRADVDAVEAALIRSHSSVRIARRQLERLTHRPIGHVADLGRLHARGPEPDHIAPWIRSAMDNQPLLAKARSQLAAAREQIRFARRAHWPDLDANAGYAYDKGRLLPSTERRQGSIGLQLTLPLFEGGVIAAKVREAEARAESLSHRLQELEDRITLETESAFLLLQNSVAGLAAATQALTSARLSLQATRKGFSLGVRTIIDLLAGIQTLENAERVYYQARYDHVILRVRLKAAAGLISTADVVAINQLLTDS